MKDATVKNALREVIARALRTDLTKEEAAEIRNNGNIVINAVKQHVMLLNAKTARINARTKRLELLREIEGEAADDREATTDAIMEMLS